MECAIDVKTGKLTFKVTGEDPKTVFKELADIQEIFGAASCCGLCGSQDIRFRVRKQEKFLFYELHCNGTDGQYCGARFEYGQLQDGSGLFPKRRDEDGNWKPNGGWAKYTKPTAGPVTDNRVGGSGW